MSQHSWRDLKVAETFSWSALALVSGEGAGPSVWFEQCTRCGRVRLASEDDGAEENAYYIGDLGLTKLEPECE